MDVLAEKLAIAAGPRMNALGVDAFGMDVGFAARALKPLHWLYRRYFRVEAKGVENIPAGPVLLVANHSGQLPLDAPMIGLAVLDSDAPRAVRGMADRWIGELPFASIFMSRMGSVVGTPENCRRLLSEGEPVLVFPEGARGVTKPFKERYRLRPFGHGFLHIALEMGVPIVPVAVVGAEEQYPSIADIRPLARLLGMPAFPLVVTPVPLPTRYRITFGQPIEFSSDGSTDDLAERVEHVRSVIQGMVDEGLRTRKHIFW